jgi:MerR family transcriptional regulator, copper efflux regulator
MKFTELENRSGLPARLIRFLISEGVVPKPEGSKRFAEYGPQHLLAIEIYKQAKLEGVDSLALVKKRISDNDQRETVEVDEGVSIRIRSGWIEDIALFTAEISKLVEKHKRGK